MVMIFMTLLAGRWPLLCTSQPLEFDESGMIAAAITAAVAPVPWKSFDPQTSGPLNVYALDLPRLVGIPVTYNSTHAVTLLLLWGTLFALYLCARRFANESIARISILPALIFLAFAFNNDFMQYASELLSLFLFSWAIVFATATWRGRNGALCFAALTGLLLGALPFAKLQSLPIAALGTVVFGVMAMTQNRAYLRDAIIAFILASLSVPVGILAIVTINGVFHDFVMSYVEMPIAYVRGTATPLSFIVADPHFAEYFLVSIATALFAAILGASFGNSAAAPRETRLFPLGAMALFAVALYTIFVPHKPWTHYVLYLIPPLSLLVASTLGLLYVRASRSLVRTVIVLASAIVILVPIVRQSLTGVEPYVGHVMAMMNSTSNDPVILALRDALHPGDRMAVWGLDPDLYAATGALLGTRDFNDKFQMEPGPLTDYYRARFVHDIVAERPRVFVDAVAPGSIEFTDRRTAGFETFPALAAVIHSRYHLVHDINGYRIYILDKSH
ncbi:MAG: hypothetical protein ACYDB1_10325 [Acidiferrobacteraceae bacterium]